MALEPNSTFGNYRIHAVIGEGGMGQVYLATDTTLDRKVAIKVLPESFAQDAERLARFEREAKTLASLNHTNIAQIHGLERREGVTAIVMELVEGPTLADRIAQGPLPPDEALRIARQIIDGLEAAHNKGIVHRDLKPANIKVTADGLVKILDFGIAKSVDGRDSSGGHSPTRMTPAMTETGVIMGTAAYMSPEQARGKAVDQRTDIWAFGCLLFEMLTGQPAFLGDDVMIVMASILRDKSDLDTLPKTLAPSVRNTIKLCLEKDPQKRLHHMGDVRLALAGSFETTGAGGAAAIAQTLPVWKRPLPLATGMLLGIALAGLAALLFQPTPAASPVNRFSFNVPAELQLRRQGENVIALAPDGRNLVINTAAGLYLRSMDTLEGRIIPGTEQDLDTPFFSADSQSVAYWTPGGSIKRISLTGGAPVVLAQGISNPQGASWDASGMILIADDDGIKRFPATGGAPELLFPAGQGETFQGPQLLPDGDTVLYAIGRANAWDEARIVAQSIATGAQALLVEGGSAARYLSTGHIVFARGNDLFALAFNPATLTTSGAVVPLVQGVQRALTTVTGLSNYSVSDDGSLAYMASSGTNEVTRSSVWVDREGQVTESGVRPCLCSDPAVSPDGTRIAFNLGDNTGSAIWIWSLAQRTFTRLTFGDEDAHSPVWSPDGERIAYGTDEALFIGRADGTGSAERLLEAVSPSPMSWSADGELVYADLSPRADRNIGVLSVSGSREPRPLLATEKYEGRPHLSPDGRWLAYESSESGAVEIYVRPYPEVDSGRWQVSQDGGSMPQWSADSRTLFFFSDEAVMAAGVIEAPTFVFDPPQPLFSRRGYSNLEGAMRAYSVAPDGEQLLMLQAPRLFEGTPRVVIVQNWPGELARLAPN